jgi:hypothetical protein
MNSWSSVVLMVLLVALKKHQFLLPFKKIRQAGENSERLPHPTAIAAGRLGRSSKDYFPVKRQQDGGINEDHTDHHCGREFPA